MSVQQKWPIAISGSGHTIPNGDLCKRFATVRREKRVTHWEARIQSLGTSFYGGVSFRDVPFAKDRHQIETTLAPVFFVFSTCDFLIRGYICLETSS